MLYVKFKPTSDGPINVELCESQRPEIQSPTDVVVMVTTAVIGPWEMAQARESSGDTTPGAQFAGIVVDVGEAVTAVDIDDLVVATCTVADTSTPTGRILFGTDGLHGGHAEYVRVPDADRSLVKTTAAAEERTVFAGGAAALGFAAADKALKRAGDGPVLVNGCDAAALCALAWLKHRRGRLEEVYAIDPHPARLAAAKSFGAREFDPETNDSAQFAVQVLGPEPVAGFESSTEFSIATDPLMEQVSRSGFEPANWPTLEQVRRAEMSIRLRQVDLTALVSTVVPLDEAAEGYRVALEAPPGIRSVLLKP